MKSSFKRFPFSTHWVHIKVYHFLVLRLSDKIFDVDLKPCMVLAYHQYNASCPNGTHTDAFTKNTERHW